MGRVTWSNEFTRRTVSLKDGASRQTWSQFRNPFLPWFPPGPDGEYFSDRPEDVAWWLGSVRGRRCPGVLVPCARRPKDAPLPRPDSGTAVTLLSGCGTRPNTTRMCKVRSRGGVSCFARNARFYFTFLVVLWWSPLPGSFTESCSFGKSKIPKFSYKHLASVVSRFITFSNQHCIP